MAVFVRLNILSSLLRDFVLCGNMLHHSYTEGQNIKTHWHMPPLYCLSLCCAMLSNIASSKNTKLFPAMLHIPFNNAGWFKKGRLKQVIGRKCHKALQLLLSAWKNINEGLLGILLLIGKEFCFMSCHRQSVYGMTSLQQSLVPVCRLNSLILYIEHFHDFLQRKNYRRLTEFGQG